jgi:hypothetical protein
MINVGSSVKVVRSPYSDVKSGTTHVVSEIRFQHFGKYWAVYILDGLPNRAFRIYELEEEKTTEET